MAHNSEEKAHAALAINEPRKETKLNPAYAGLKPDSDNKLLNKEFYRINSLNNINSNEPRTCEPQDLERLVNKMRQFNHIIGQASRRHDVPKKLIAAIIQVESNWDTESAEGLMQLQQLAQEETGVKNASDVKQNINGGTQYLKQMCVLFGCVELGIVAYNIGPTKLRIILADRRYRKIPPDAIQYAQRVMYLYQSA